MDVDLTNEFLMQNIASFPINMVGSLVAIDRLPTMISLFLHLVQPERQRNHVGL